MFFFFFLAMYTPLWLLDRRFIFLPWLWAHVCTLASQRVARGSSFFSIFFFSFFLVIIQTEDAKNNVRSLLIPQPAVFWAETESELKCASQEKPEVAEVLRSFVKVKNIKTLLCLEVLHLKPS